MYGLKPHQPNTQPPPINNARGHNECWADKALAQPTVLVKRYSWPHSIFHAAQYATLLTPYLFRLSAF